MRDSDPWLLANLTVPVLLAKVLEKRTIYVEAFSMGKTYGNLKNIQMFVPVFNAAKL